ncbi:hypothetical protein BGX26_002187 [Mortierella sp. AD094]|nr:hypothetical protein BGX26_002187 [Mortierella sp. AD094]
MLFTAQETRYCELQMHIQKLLLENQVNGRSPAECTASRATTPANLIAPDTSSITPDLLPPIDTTQDDIDTIVKQIEGGVANIQDIYALSPLQDSILSHHIATTKSDPYLVATLMSFDNREILDRYLAALQNVVDRHDIFRTAFIWEGLSKPAQVVLCHAPVHIAEMALNPADGPVSEQLAVRFNPREVRINLAQAPLIRLLKLKHCLEVKTEN